MSEKSNQDLGDILSQVLSANEQRVAKKLLNKFKAGDALSPAEEKKLREIEARIKDTPPQSTWEEFPETADTIEDLATHLGKSRVRIYQYRKQYPDAPKPLAHKGAKESVWLWLDFLQRHGFLNAEETDEETISWKREREKWAAKREKIKYEQEANKLGDIDEISTRIQAAAREFITELTKLLYSDLPPELEGKEARDISRIMKKRTQDFVDSFVEMEKRAVEQETSV